MMKEYININLLPKEIQQDIGTAEEAASNVFPRGRDVAIGACMIAGGKTYSGANIGRRSFNNSTCAERMALDKALFNGVKHIDRITIIGLNNEEPFEEVVAPCGACRQILFEAVNRLDQDDITLYLVNTNKTKIVEVLLSELLPLVYINSKRE